MARDLAEANPQAFRNGDPGALIVGKQIRLIDYGDGVAGAPPQPAPAPAAAPPPGGAAGDADTGDDADAPADDPAPSPVASKPPSTLTSIGQISRIRGEPVAIDLNVASRRTRPSTAATP